MCNGWFTLSKRECVRHLESFLFHTISDISDVNCSIDIVVNLLITNVMSATIAL